MRAYRLLSILLLLKARGRVTARELAARLEVSPRTIYRDMDALAAAGAPVYAERGNQGGWRLLDGSALDLPALDDAQLRALQLGGRRDLLDDLGLRWAAELAWTRLEPRPDERDLAVEERLLVEGSSWRERRADATALPIIQQAVFRGRRLRMLYDRGGEPVARTVDPLGLVVKGSTWYLAAAVDGEPRTYRVSRVLEATLLADDARRPDGFRLREWWDAQQRDFVQRLPRFAVRALARGRALSWLSAGGWFATIERQSEPDRDGFSELELAFESETSVLAWAFASGADVVLLEPPELRNRLAEQAALVLRHLQRSTAVTEDIAAVSMHHE
jgi:predicted DNA-binding transcriptional regulator YafY